MSPQLSSSRIRLAGSSKRHISLIRFKWITESNFFLTRIGNKKLFNKKTIIYTKPGFSCCNLRLFVLLIVYNILFNILSKFSISSNICSFESSTKYSVRILRVETLIPTKLYLFEYFRRVASLPTYLNHWFLRRVFASCRWLEMRWLFSYSLFCFDLKFKPDFVFVSFAAVDVAVVGPFGRLNRAKSDCKW